MSTALATRNGFDDQPSQEIAHAIAGTMEQLKAIRTFVKEQFDIGYKDRDGKIVPGMDAGLIPGCGDKPTLFLPGAQKATMYFNCFPTFKVHQADLGNGHVTFRVRCLLISRATREQVGEGIGCCSTMEKKYRWRGNAILCPSCTAPAIFKSKQKPEFYCWTKKGGCGQTFKLNHTEITSQGDGSPSENPDLYDLHNTVLKMAKKRAHVDAAMTLGCLSELFTQDIEDTYNSTDVREAARPYDGEVTPDVVTSSTVVEEYKQSPSLKGTGLFAGEHKEKTRAVVAWIGKECGAANEDWQVSWYGDDQKGGLFTPFVDAGEAVPEKIDPLIHPNQAKSHMLKWAISAGLIDPNLVNAETKVSQTDALITVAYEADKKGFAREVRDYIARQRAIKEKALYRKHPELAPDGHFADEEPPEPIDVAITDRGDSYEAPDVEARAEDAFSGPVH